jgi:hypothetical protein
MMILNLQLVGTPRCGVRFIGEAPHQRQIADAAARRPYLWKN